MQYKRSIDNFDITDLKRFQTVGTDTAEVQTAPWELFWDSGIYHYVYGEIKSNVDVDVCSAGLAYLTLVKRA